MMSKELTQSSNVLFNQIQFPFVFRITLTPFIILWDGMNGSVKKMNYFVLQQTRCLVKHNLLFSHTHTFNFTDFMYQ